MNPVKRVLVVSVFVLLVCANAGIIFVILKGPSDRDIKEEFLMNFKSNTMGTSYAPRGEVTGFELDSSGFLDTAVFYRIRVPDPATLRKFVTSQPTDWLRKFMTSRSDWFQGNFPTCVTNKLQFFVQEFDLGRHELPDLGQQNLKWRIAANPKFLNERFLPGYLCIVDEKSRIVWIFSN